MMELDRSFLLGYLDPYIGFLLLDDLLQLPETVELLILLGGARKTCCPGGLLSPSVRLAYQGHGCCLVLAEAGS